jgi:hypothetical protein
VKLFQVTTTAYVLAEDKDAALDALRDAGELSPDPGSTIDICEAAAVDAEWYNALPYGDDPQERTCGQIIQQLIGGEEL